MADAKDLPGKAHRTAFVLYGIALAETLVFRQRPTSRSGAGGITGLGECGAYKAGELVLGQLLGDPRGAAVESMSQLNGVPHVYPRVAALFPMRAQGGRSLLGRDVYTDVFASGVDAALIQADLTKGTVFENNVKDPFRRW